MCGIAGQFVLNGEEADAALVGTMGERLAHRGPDGEGSFFSGPVGLAHRRLAIIDLSDEGRQPMGNEDGTLQIVFNGEIYNFREIREELVAAGHRFASATDTEVILHAYEEWGRNCLARFNGMWAFALWDGRRRELFCARDRLGVKPFYYTLAGDSFIFASEIKALRVHPGVGRRPNDRMLSTFLAWGVADHTAETMYDGVFQLPPAHALVVSADGVGEPERYWDFAMSGALGGVDDEAAARSVRALLTDAVRLRLRSDVPVGTCLSGGIDSSTVTALINELLQAERPESVGERQKTFSVCFDDLRFDESRYIDTVVAVTNVAGRRTTPGTDGLWEDIERLLYMQDEPFASLSIYAQYCVMRLAQGEVKVVLDGQGADEQLGGYIAYQAPYIRGLLRHGDVLAALREGIGSARLHGSFISWAARQSRVRSERRELLRGSPPEVLRYAGSLEEVLKREVTASNLPLLLHWEDRNSMAFSIEARVPFLDYRLVEHLAGLPLDQKIRGGVTKYVLRRAIRGLVPDAVRCRMDKMGFVTPEEVWMKGELAPHILELFSTPEFTERPYWDAERVLENYRAFLEGKSPYSTEFWRIACAEMWLQGFATV
ncbi:asparagine synthase (glutamine-hydrolyzing) [Methanoculleus sp. FWC-SCC3]|uniref:Putative asparagine synthetase [glutamine-hydrolyzing] n=1 Tax=Methanoculleus methanifontis TaxID=2584086 RepID=A0ABT8LXT5_9EURY|nr:asparagine synthase (glutamine-hydrolyzing) [Methanoculleus sp. FWC-SCC3]MDN7011482.1 asparagine synthase (glutamine-hydrolyzing) [Methanoculleus sp. FWC-SCC3]